jgi:malate dehydrogenase (oxaloacetate-decarboxylating)(NADP+)
MGVVAAQSRRVNDDMLLIAAKTVGNLVTPDRLAVGCLYPPTEDLLSVSHEIAIAVAKVAHASKLADTNDVSEESLRRKMYNPHSSYSHGGVVDLSKALA